MGAVEKDIIDRSFFELVPFNVAIIDKDFNVVKANKKFEEYFGAWENSRCFEVCKKSLAPCKHCKVNEVFETGLESVSDETGVNQKGKICKYIVHFSPIKDEKGEVQYVIEMSSDVTEANLREQESNILFERVPCYITMIDRNYKIIRSNEKFRDTFGDVESKFCYEVYKKSSTPCNKCPARLSFEDGNEHSSAQIGLSYSGDEKHYIVNTTPIASDKDGISLVMEIATDITEINNLQEQLQKDHDFHTTVINNSSNGIVALNNEGGIRIFNPMAREMLNWKSADKPDLDNIRKMLPESFFKSLGKEHDKLGVREQNIHTVDDNEIPVKFDGVALKSQEEYLGKVAFMQDLRHIKQLERDKLDAERLAAVGQTVAGLAHTIKNILMGLEGGMYMVDSGLRSANTSRIFEGWDVLQRNFTKTTQLVKDFLSFSKGKLPVLKMVDPNAIVDNIIDLYHDTASNRGVKLIAELAPDMKLAPLDPEGMEACLTNLVSNGIDASLLREDKKGIVILRTIENDDEIIFEVVDNGSGMEDEVYEKIFTTFFTTKGGKGTGLGLLTTRKIVQEHGGAIEVDTEKGIGSTFRIRLPKDRLKMILDETRTSINI